MRFFRTLVIAASALLVPVAALAQAAERTVTVAFGAEPTTLDPARASAGADFMTLHTMFERLVAPNPKLERQNWLAKSWEVIKEGDHYILDITIRDDVKFHNGDPLTSEDFKYSYERMANPALSRWTHLQRQIREFEIIDDHRFRLHFNNPDGAYIANDLTLWAMPKKYIEEVGDEGFARHPIGTGPWKFVERQVNGYIRFEAFEDYWNEEARPRGIDQLTLRFIPEDQTRVAALVRGEVDLIDSVPPVHIAALERDKNVELARVVGTNNLFFNFPTYDKSKPFHDVRVRKAIAHAIDMDAIIKTVLFGQGVRYAQVAEGGVGYDPDLKPYEYNPALARALLREAGYPNGFTTPCYSLTTPRELNIREMAEAAFAYLSAIGIRCQVRGLEYQPWINMGRRAGGEQVDGIIIWMWAHGLPGDPTVPWLGHLHSYVEGQGLGSYSQDNDPKADEMVIAASRLMDPKERDAALRELARYKHENVLGGIPAYRPLVTLAWRSDRINFTPWPMGSYRALQEIELK